MNVLGATYANCDGRYKYTDDQVDWAPERPVFKHVTKDRYIVWLDGEYRWSISDHEILIDGATQDYFHTSKNSFILYGHYVEKLY